MKEEALSEKGLQLKRLVLLHRKQSRYDVIDSKPW
jgi:hypothetical protein